MSATLRTGSRVRAPHDAQHTDRGVIEAVSDRAPVATVLFDCACRAYVPLARLVADRLPAPASCEVVGCALPRFPGPYCAAHAACRPAPPARGRSVVRAEGEGQKHAPPAPVRPQREFAAIDDEGTRGQVPAHRGTRPGQVSATGGEDGHTTGAGVDRPTPRAGSTPAGSIPRAGETGAPLASAAGPTPPAAPDAEVDRGASADAGRPVRPARTAAGVPSRAPAADRRRNNGSSVYWTRERVVVALRSWAAAHGRTPSEIDWGRSTRGEHPGKQTVYNRFGSWNAAIDAAGLERNELFRWPPPVILDRIREWVATYGEPPSASDWSPTLARYHGRYAAAKRFVDAEGHWPGFKTVRGAFGTWGAAIRAAGFEPLRSGPRKARDDEPATAAA